MRERSDVDSKGIIGETIPKALSEPGSVHDQNEHDYEDMNLLGKVLCEICYSLRKLRISSKTSSLLIVRRLSIFHKGRFKG